MKNIIRHGEVILLPIDTIPKGAVLKEETKKKVVAHSETGHHHVLETLDMSKLKVYTWQGDTYIEVPEIAKLWHQKEGTETHKTHTVQPSAYKVIIKQSYDYFKKKMSQVRD